MSLLKQRIAAGVQSVPAAQRVAQSQGSALPENIRQRILEELLAGVPRDWVQRVSTDPQFVREMERRISELVDLHTSATPSVSRTQAVQEIVQDILGYGPIQRLIDDPEVSEIMVNAYDDIRVEKHGVIERVPDLRFRDLEHGRNTLAKILSPLGREISESTPMVDARLRDGSRVHAVVSPVALSGLVINIRKFGQMPSLKQMIEAGTLDDRMATLLRLSVEGRLNIIVSGGTGSGKTTLLNVLSNFIPEPERVLTIEETSELQLQQDHVVQLEGRPANMEGKGGVTIRNLVMDALRMRPDRIVVGEVRGGEALDMLQAMNTGHDGSLTTVHANTAQDVFSRLVTLVLMAGEGLTETAIHAQIASAVQLIVHTARFADGRRRVTEIVELSGLGGGHSGGQGTVQVQTIFSHWRSSDSFHASGVLPRSLGRLQAAGIEVPLGIFEPDPEPKQGEGES